MADSNLSATTDPASALNSTLLTVRYVLYCSALPIYLAQLPVSLLSVLCVLSSSVLHRNLKLVLLAQSACLLLFASSCIAQIANIFAYGPNGWQRFRILQAQLLFSSLFAIMIGHVLLMERIMATVFVKNYEQKRHLWFPLCWFPTITVFAMLNAYTETYQSEHPDSVMNITTGTLSSVYISLALSLLEMCVFSAIGIYNRKLYGARNDLHGKTLTERYQLSENIRTARQLSPTFMLHFANILCLTALVVILYYKLIDDSLFVMSILYWPMSLNNLIIEISIIWFHPILRRNARDRLSCLFQSSKIGPAVDGGQVELDEQNKSSSSRTVVPKCIEGKELILRSGEEQHRRLTQSWQ